MKRKLTYSILIVVALLAVVVMAGNSIMFGNIDSTWGLPDEGPVADPNNQFTDGGPCVSYASGPPDNVSNPNDYIIGSNIFIGNATPTAQFGNNTDWNQVRWGVPYEGALCGVRSERFASQSGLAFNGHNAIIPSVNYEQNEPFVLGKLCHINNPTYSLVGTVRNYFQSTSANLVIEGVSCGPQATLVNPQLTPIPGGVTSLHYAFSVRMQETTNRPPCYYPSPWNNPCSDAIIPGQPAEFETLKCLYNSGVDIDFKIAVVGFTDIGLNSDCANQDYETATPKGLFVSQEGTTNCACVWAAIVDRIPNAVSLNFFKTSAGKAEIVLQWQTAFETDNVGFNVYRSESLSFDDAIQLNESLIDSLVPPGSTFGADYQFADNTAEIYKEYFYWIEDVDVNGVKTLHGPEFAEWVD